MDDIHNMKNTLGTSSHLAKILGSGCFAITAETTPRTTTDLQSVVDRALPLKGIADAVNVTDGAGAKAHISSLVVAGSLLQCGVEPVLQVTLRDRNRIALQSDVLGAAAMGVSNILVLKGDPIEVGDEKEAKFVLDFAGSTDLVALFTMMRDRGLLSSGRSINNPPSLFIGVADAPFVPPADWEPQGLEAKLQAGANFVQTQYCFDMCACRSYFSRLSDFGIPERTSILVGIGPFTSERQAVWMNENLPGVEVPDAILLRLRKALDQRAEGQKICIELLQQLREIQGVAGAHLMGPGQESAVAEIIVESGIINDRSSE